MSQFGDETPDRMWWCNACNGGVGVWGVDRPTPPPRCPACHENKFSPVKFVPENDEFLMHLIDHVWSVAHENDSVPETTWAKAMLEAARVTFVVKKRKRGE